MRRLLVWLSFCDTDIAPMFGFVLCVLLYQVLRWGGVEDKITRYHSWVYGYYLLFSQLIFKVKS